MLFGLFAAKNVLLTLFRARRLYFRDAENQFVGIAEMRIELWILVVIQRQSRL